MRTTVEIRDEYRARLLEIAARRGEKGFSHLLDEALSLYLESMDRCNEDRQRALGLRGVLSEDEAGRFEERVRTLRESWR